MGISEADIFEKYVDHPGTDCYTENSPEEWREYCFDFSIALGVGSGGDILPEHLGDPIGDSNGDTYYRLEVHYENPTGKYCMQFPHADLFVCCFFLSFKMTHVFVFSGG